MKLVSPNIPPMTRHCSRVTVAEWRWLILGTTLSMMTTFISKLFSNDCQAAEPTPVPDTFGCSNFSGSQSVYIVLISLI